VPFYPFFLKEVKIHSSCCYNEADFREVMAMVSRGELKGFEKMVTSRIALEDVVDKGLLELINNKDEQVKILISPKLRRV
jgi:threonine dehydrogenase-like Zn-dependent dehydrogenase